MAHRKRNVDKALGTGLIAFASNFWLIFVGNSLLGFETAFVYPTLPAAIGDEASPSTRASSVGIYRLWRDSGYAE